MLHQPSSICTALGAQWLVIGMKRVKPFIIVCMLEKQWMTLEVMGGGGSIPAAVNLDSVRQRLLICY